MGNAGSTNPPWAASVDTGRAAGDKIGTCERACLNKTASSGDVLDSLTNFGGNAMYRKFVYETMTSGKTATQGFASCADKIKWTSNVNIADNGMYQNYSDWMTIYSSMKTGQECVPTAACTYTGTENVIPFVLADAQSGTVPGCYQAAAMASADVMFALSYIASCAYVKSFAYITAVKKGGACFDLGDGLVYLICAQGLVGAAFFMVTVVGIMGYRRFNSDNYAENKKESSDATDAYDDAGVKPDDEAFDDGTELSVTGVEPSIAYGNDPPAAATSRDQWV